VTLPLILARERDPELAALDLRSIADAAAAERVCNAIAATGALEEARTFALSHVADAKRAIKGLELPAKPARLLDLVADGVVERYS
jgi:geranylgeranyl pyrophosphate synthase